MGSGTMQVSDYRTKQGYYLSKDYDAKVGGEFWFLIEPLIGNDDEVFFYIRALPNGKFEVEGEAYIITDPDRLKSYKNDAVRTRRGKKLFYYHLDSKGDILRKEAYRSRVKPKQSGGESE